MSTPHNLGNVSPDFKPPPLFIHYSRTARSRRTVHVSRQSELRYYVNRNVDDMYAMLHNFAKYRIWI
jgi:hypothetical protein